MKRVRLGDRDVWALNAFDAALLHHQIFEAGAYAPVRVDDGACVFDVGANIGLFSLWLSARHSGLKLFAFEPIPEVFAALEKNAPPATKLFACGLSSKRGEATFAYDPFVSSTATMHPAALKATMERIGPAAWAEAVAADLAKAGLGPSMGGAVARVAVGALDVARKLTAKTVTCPLRTISDVIAEHHVDRIDLLKVDVEGAEADVLAGITDADWPKIRQVAIEATDADAIARVLRERGFTVEIAQEDWATFRLLGLHNVCGRR